MYFCSRLACVFFALVTSVAAADDSPDDALASLVGTWKASGTAGGMDLAGTFSAKWGDDKSCVISNYAFTLGGESIKAHHITGWDASTESIRVLGFFSHGVMEDFHYKKDSPGVYKGVYAGSKDGEKFKGELTVTVAVDSFKFETTGLSLKRGGEPVPELSVTLSRVKE